MTLALGLMSGTSADGVSAALVSFKGRSFRLLSYRTFPYPKPLRKKILKARRLTLSEISRLDFELGNCFARVILNWSAGRRLFRRRVAAWSPGAGRLARRRISSREVAVIGSHGQTIYHGPRDNPPCTLQIGEAAVIAEKTGIPVVSDFRPQDIALGGEGAPLIPFFDHYFYGKGPVRAFQNIGGIANVTIVGRRLKEPIAFDTGPGNCLMDLAIQKITRVGAHGGVPHHFDRNGSWARQGKVDYPVVEKMFRHPYFKRKPPKSTGREEFGEEFLKQYFGRTIFTRPYDTLATLTYFTAWTIYESMISLTPAFLRHGRPGLNPAYFSGPAARRAAGSLPSAPKRSRSLPFGPTDRRAVGNPGYGEDLHEMVVSGGGAKNPVLMKHLKNLFSPLPVRSIESLGIPAQAKEPIAFAFFALRAIQRKINHLPSATGAKRATILGKIVRPSTVIASPSDAS